MSVLVFVFFIFSFMYMFIIGPLINQKLLDKED